MGADAHDEMLNNQPSNQSFMNGMGSFCKFKLNIVRIEIKIKNKTMYDSVIISSEQFSFRFF